VNIADRIKAKVIDALQPEYLDLINESHMHAGPATDSHFKLVVVATGFRAQGRVKRHQALYRVLQDELQSSGKGGLVHALALHLHTPEEWAAVAVPESPRCAGQNKH